MSQSMILEKMISEQGFMIFDFDVSGILLKSKFVHLKSLIDFQSKLVHLVMVSDGNHFNFLINYNENCTVFFIYSK